MPARNLDPIRARAKFFFEGARKFFIKGVTYGTFKPDADGFMVNTPEKARRDLAMMREIGINVVRVYTRPPRWFLDLCAEHGIRALVTLWWGQNFDFLDTGRERRRVVDKVRADVRANAGHPALFGYLVANEISSTMTRWYGPDRVREFLEKLIRVGRKEDPRVLFSYASFPPTEYLIPTNADFLTYNVYLHRQLDFDRYLARLQNLAEDKPLIMGEFGMDTLRHSEDEHAEMIGWHIESVVRAGLAGTFVYAWTDEWHCGGFEITDWKFGITTDERAPKKAYHVVKELFAGERSLASRVALPSYPRVSVIVCSYNGGKTLKDCLEALDQLNYPNFEIVLVDDGSKDNTRELVAAFEKNRLGSACASRAGLGASPKQSFGDAASEKVHEGEARALPGFQNIVQKNMGLSFARNVGARAATGEIFAYTDSDCMPDPDWLYYLVGTLLSGNFAGVGGPNISPPAANWIQAAVAAAPGGPSHVLLTDVVAEHIPGCNMAFHRWAFESVGGFDPEYRKAGDDVDFCWRLQTSGGVIAFSPSAIVWHYRRFTLDAFRKQQEGYGEAESMLRFKHLIFFGPTGTAKWKGQIYGAPRFTWLLNKPTIYHGVFGEGLFQSIYPAAQSEVAAYLSCIEWVVLTALVFLLAIAFPALRIVPYLMFGGTFLVALSYMMSARIEPKFDTIPARLLVAFLALMQPLGRGWARYFTWLKFKRTPQSVIAHPEESLAPASHRGGITKLEFWNEAGVGREKLLAETVALIEDEGWRYSADTGWKNWDVQIYGNFWWSITLRSVTEYHGGPKCYTRVRLSYKPVATTTLANLLALALLFYKFVTSLHTTAITWPLLFNRLAHADLVNRSLQIIYAVWLLMLCWRAWQLKRRVADLVLVAAQRSGLARVSGKNLRAQS